MHLGSFLDTRIDAVAILKVAVEQRAEVDEGLGKTDCLAVVEHEVRGSSAFFGILRAGQYQPTPPLQDCFNSQQPAS